MFGGIRSGKAEMTCDTRERHVSTASVLSRKARKADVWRRGTGLREDFVENRGAQAQNGGTPLSTDSDLVDRPRGEGPH